MKHPIISDKHYRQLIASMSDAFAVVGMDGYIREFDVAFQRLLGYEPAELVKLKFRDITPPKWHQFEETILQNQLFPRGYTDTYRKEYQRKDGSVFPVELRTFLNKDKEGRPIEMVAVVRDISDVAQLEESIRRNLDMTKTILDTVDALVVVTDMEGSILLFNKACERLTDWKAEEVLGRKFIDFLVPPEQVDGVTEAIAKSKTGVFPIRHENEWVVRDGTRRWISWVNAAFLDGEGSPYMLMGTGIDVTAQRSASAALSESEERFRSIVKKSPMGMHLYRLDENKNLLLVDYNDSASRFTGIDLASHLNKPIELIFPELEGAGVCSVYRRIAEIGGSWEAKELRYRDDSVDGIFDVYAFQTSPGCVTVNFLEVSQRVKALEIQSELETQLLQAQKIDAIGRLAGGIAHDFNNLLTVIMGYADALAPELEHSEDLHSQALQIVKAGQKAASLTGQLLAFSRKQVLQPKVFDLNSLILENGKMLGRLIGEDVELSTTLGRDIKKIKADPGQIEQIIVNLVLNARDALPSGGQLSIETSNFEISEELIDGHATLPPGAYVLLTIRDNGIGMDEDTQQRMFEPFFTTKAKGKGTGLGLPTTYGIVSQSGGYIQVFSSLGNGTTISVYMPACDEDATERILPSDVGHGATGSETILVVEDEEMVRSLASTSLQRFGYRVLCAKDGFDALQVSANYDGVIDLLLTDVIMPQMNGLQLASALIPLRPKMKVVFMSGYTDKILLDQSNFDPATQYLQKPFSPDRLSKCIRASLDSPDIH